MVTRIPAVAAPSSPEAWWDVDADVLTALADGAKSPEQIGEALGIPAPAAASLVAMLAQQGKVKIRLVEAV